MDQGPIFVVGCPRSGTTLLRLMLMGHPRIHIPDESHFIVALARHSGEPPEELVERIVTHRRFWALGITADVAREAVAGATDLPSTVDAVFRAAAGQQGKARWGDKTPGYAAHIPLLAGLFPEAVFVHIIRDGRDVAASLAGQDWGPPSAVSGAFWWRRKVAAGRRGGRKVGADRYMEVSYEQLCDSPEDVLRRVCAFIGEDFDPAMLEYRSSAEAYIAVRRDRLPSVHHLLRPPTTGLRRTDTVTDPATQRAVAAVCHRRLVQCGYESDRPAAADIVRAYVRRVGDLPAAVRPAVRARIRTRDRLV